MHLYAPAVSLSSAIVPGCLGVEAEVICAPICTCGIAQQCNSS